MCKSLFSTVIALGAVVGLAGLPTTAVAQQQCYSSVTGELEAVGETRLRVYFFRVYDATLFTDSGSYPDDTQVALQLNYLRSIRASQLVDTTRDEWERLGYDIDDRAEQWLEQLADIWPDVDQGDCLVAHTQGNDGVRFYNDEGALGAIDDSEFAERFLAIWLSENSSFRRNRDELVGAR